MLDASGGGSIWEEAVIVLYKRAAFEFDICIVSFEIETTIIKCDLFLYLIRLKAKKPFLDSVVGYLRMKFCVDQHPPLFHFGGKEGVVCFKAWAVLYQEKFSVGSENLFEASSVGDMDFFDFIIDKGSCEEAVFAFYERARSKVA